MDFLKNKKTLDKILTIILLIIIISSVIFLFYIILNPHPSEKFTEFYLLGPNKKADDYPSNLLVGENASVIIGIVNHEQKTMDYTIEIWLINESTIDNETIYHNMWFIDKINITLEHKPINIEESWEPQWEHNYNFSINKTGKYKIAFLLYTQPTDNYDVNIDYEDIAKEKIKNSYRELHLWINIEQ